MRHYLESLLSADGQKLAGLRVGLVIFHLAQSFTRFKDSALALGGMRHQERFSIVEKQQIVAYHCFFVGDRSSCFIASYLYKSMTNGHWILFILLSSLRDFLF